MKYSKLKIAIIGAGSVNFCPPTLSDILLSDMLNSLPLEVCVSAPNTLGKPSRFPAVT